MAMITMPLGLLGQTQEKYQTGTIEGKNYAFIDANGNPQNLVGINTRNVIEKVGSVYRAKYSQNQFNEIATKGFDHIRISFYWREFQPNSPESNLTTRGFDQTALLALDEVIERAEKAGLGVILDPLHITGDVDKSKNPWIYRWTLPDWAWGTDLNKRTDKSISSELVFWKLRNNNAALQYLEEFVARYADDPTVISIDFVNEPREPGDNSGPNTADLHEKNENLIEMYEDWIEALRDIDSDKIFILEPFYGNVKININSNTLLSLPKKENIVWSFHDYYAGAGSADDGFQSNGRAGGTRTEGYEPPFGTYDNRSNAISKMKDHINVHLNAAKEAGIPMHIGEFGIPVQVDENNNFEEGWIGTNDDDKFSGAKDFMCDKREVYTDLGLPFTAWVWNKDKDGHFGIYKPNSNYNDLGTWMPWTDNIVNENCGEYTFPSSATCELVKNGDFNNGKTNFYPYIDDRSNVSAFWNIVNGYSKISIANGSDAQWKYQLIQGDLDLQQGKTYKIKYRARASYSKNIYVKLSNETDRFQYMQESETLETSWKNYEYEFTMSNNITDARLNFGIGGNNNVDIYFDNISIEEVNCTTVLPTCNLLKDASFDSKSIGKTTDVWDVYANDIANATITANSGEVFANIGYGGTANWHVQLYQGNLSIENGKRYLVSFRAKSNTNRNIVLDIGKATSPYNNYYQETIPLTTNWETKYFIFDSNLNYPDARIVFNMGRNNGEVWIDDVVFEELSCSNIDNIIKNSHFDTGTTNWDLYTRPGSAQSSWQASNGVVKHNIVDGGSAFWHVQQIQSNLNLTPGTYTLSFKAQTDAARTIYMELSNGISPHTNYFSGPVDLSNKLETYNITFTVNVNNANARLVFNMGTNGQDVDIDDVLLVKESGGGLRTVLETKINKLNVFPNPVINELQIVLTDLGTQAGDIAIYDIQGKKVLEHIFTENTDKVKLNVANLSRGMYVLQVQIGYQLFSHKLMKVN